MAGTPAAGRGWGCVNEGPPDVASRIPSIVVKIDSWQSGCMHEPAGKQETKSLGAN